MGGGKIKIKSKNTHHVNYWTALLKLKAEILWLSHFLAEHKKGIF